MVSESRFTLKIHICACMLPFDPIPGVDILAHDNDCWHAIPVQVHTSGFDLGPSGSHDGVHLQEPEGVDLI